jgi:hypothetical protein
MYKRRLNSVESTPDRQTSLSSLPFFATRCFGEEEEGQQEEEEGEREKEAEEELVVVLSTL